MENKYYKPLTLIIAFLILGLVTVSSFAYFSANVNGNNNARDNVITTGFMEIKFEDEPDEEIFVEGMLPGSVQTKTFQVKNTGTVDTNYDIYLNRMYIDLHISHCIHNINNFYF